ncbi:CD209 antigen-like protein C isoform X1 [Pantherophis guttatus]|uniref:CD209 antigen-like protein C isoform X1 n=2 Tax=Pantherophis guttatus TaxID=94885 RepID=A0ABM3Z895_PANGU|nr:CD209 antigen-like protein C isoform X1 [Pantherophis guttatus]
MDRKNQHAKRPVPPLPNIASQTTGIYMSAGALTPFPVPPEDSPSHLDDDDYDDGSAVTISLPAKAMEKKEAPSICKPAKENNSRKLHIPILYVLVAIGFATWITFFFLVLEKYSEISEKIENLNLSNSEKFAKNSEISEKIENLNLNNSEKFAKMMKDLDYVKTTQLMAEQYSSNRFTETEDILESVCSWGKITIDHSCPYRWKHQRKYCYYFSTEKTNWTNALSNCINRNAYLVSISSDDEQGFLTNNLNEVDYWLGMSDLEGAWKWKDSGMLISTSFWNRGEPSKDENKDCGIMYPNGTWASAVCSAQNRWICKKKLIC